MMMLLSKLVIYLSTFKIIFCLRFPISSPRQPLIGFGIGKDNGWLQKNDDLVVKISSTIPLDFGESNSLFDAMYNSRTYDSEGLHSISTLSVIYLTT